jgi:hypothetical protein
MSRNSSAATKESVSSSLLLCLLSRGSPLFGTTVSSNVKVITLLFAFLSGGGVLVRWLVLLRRVNFIFPFLFHKLFLGGRERERKGRLGRGGEGG